MKICAEFFEEEKAIKGHQALLDAGVSPQAIELRSAYPMAESAVPPHRSHPMLMRSWVRMLWVFGASFGFSFLAFTQLIWPLHTGGHPLVALPIDFIITYECGMITGLVMTITFLYIETMRYRNLNPPIEEDRPVEHGNIALIVHGTAVERASEILKSHGAASIAKYGLMIVLFFSFLPGCAVKMRDQDYVKSTETSQVSQPKGVLEMPSEKAQSEPFVKAAGYFHPPQMRILDKKKLTVPAAFINLKNPVSADKESVARGQLLFAQNCAFCHGPQGYGNGPVGEVFMPTPANLTGEMVKHETDGAIFYKIRIGQSTMPSFANRLSTRDIFDLVNYIRSLQK